MAEENEYIFCTNCGVKNSIDAKFCRECGSEFKYKKANTNYKPAPECTSQGPLYVCYLIVGFVLLVSFSCLVNYLFFNPLDELTRGCVTNDTYKDDYDGGKRWYYYCKDKPWDKVEVRLDENTKFKSYYVEKEFDKRMIIRGEYYWSKGDYNHNISIKDWDLRWEYYKSPRDLYKGVCTKREFVDRLKETIRNNK